jgi:hypothetical protein
VVNLVVNGQVLYVDKSPCLNRVRPVSKQVSAPSLDLQQPGRPDDRPDLLADVLVEIGCVRSLIGERWPVRTRVGVQLGVFFVGTAQRVDSRHAIIRRPSTED